jgi:hypothetical protein
MSMGLHLNRSTVEYHRFTYLSGDVGNSGTTVQSSREDEMLNSQNPSVFTLAIDLDSPSFRGIVLG